MSPRRSEKLQDLWPIAVRLPAAGLGYQIREQGLECRFDLLDYDPKLDERVDLPLGGVARLEYDRKWVVLSAPVTPPLSDEITLDLLACVQTAISDGTGGLDLYDIEQDVAGQIVMTDLIESDRPVEQMVEDVLNFGETALLVRDKVRGYVLPPIEEL